MSVKWETLLRQYEISVRKALNFKITISHYEEETSTGLCTIIISIYHGNTQVFIGKKLHWSSAYQKTHFALYVINANNYKQHYVHARPLANRKHTANKYISPFIYKQCCVYVCK
jgi:hypothetical protein